MSPWQNRLPESTRPFLQPMALILVCIVFIALILFTGLMDLRRLDQTLHLFMENHGLDISGRIQRDAQENFNSLTQVLRGDHSGDALFPFTEETFLLQETFINALVNLTRHIDKSIDAEKPDAEGLRRIVADNHLSLLAVVNEKGKAVYQSRPFSNDLLQRAAPVASGRTEISIDIFNRSIDRGKLGSIALKRSAGTGTILAAWDDQGLRYWGLKVAFRKAIDEVSRGQKLPYIGVIGTDRSILAGTGDLPAETAKDDSALAGVMKGNVRVSSRKITFQDRKLFDIMAPIQIDNALAGVVRMGLEGDQADQVLSKNKGLMIISMAFIMMIGLLSIWFLYQNQNRHFSRIDEMRKELQKSERLSSLGQLAAGVAHEIRNPLNAISMASQRLLREFAPEDQGKMEEFSRITGVIRDEVRRLNGIIEEFLAFSRSQRLELREYPIESVLQKLVRLETEEAMSRGISMETRWGDNSTCVPMDVDKLQQALLNIIKNAMESISGGGTIAISLESRGNEKAVVSIADTGTGLTPEEIDRIFNPEYTTKEKGLGLGLPIAYEIIRGHGGDIRVESRVGVGTTFEIQLPLKKTG